MNGIAWSKAGVDRLKSLWAQRYTAREIGEKLGRSRGSVLSKLLQLGLLGKRCPGRVGNNRGKGK